MSSAGLGGLPGYSSSVSCWPGECSDRGSRPPDPLSGLTSGCPSPVVLRLGPGLPVCGMGLCRKPQVCVGKQGLPKGLGCGGPGGRTGAESSRSTNKGPVAANGGLMPKPPTPSLMLRSTKCLERFSQISHGF
nr:Aldh16a1 protein [synthetic construct]